MTTTLNGTTAPVTGRRRTYAATPFDWRTAANCATTDPDLFHPEGHGAAITSQERDALRVCGRCDVREKCLDWALATRQTDGVWGGTTPRQRRSMRRPAERQWDRCLNAQAWIEAGLGEGRTQKSLADELGVDKAVMNRAIRHFRFQRYLNNVVTSEEAVA